MVIAKRIDDEKKMKEKKKSDDEKKAADKNHKRRLDPGSTGAAALAALGAAGTGWELGTSNQTGGCGRARWPGCTSST